MEYFWNEVIIARILLIMMSLFLVVDILWFVSCTEIF
jgi:hypothetical protein